jgi:hypothetical protein
MSDKSHRRQRRIMDALHGLLAAAMSTLQAASLSLPLTQAMANA